MQYNTFFHDLTGLLRTFQNDGVSLVLLSGCYELWIMTSFVRCQRWGLLWTLIWSNADCWIRFYSRAYALSSCVCVSVTSRWRDFVPFLIEHRAGVLLKTVQSRLWTLVFWCWRSSSHREGITPTGVPNACLRKIATFQQTSMSVLLIVESKCTLAASLPPGESCWVCRRTDRRTDGQRMRPA